MYKSNNPRSKLNGASPPHSAHPKVDAGHDVEAELQPRPSDSINRFLAEIALDFGDTL